MKKILTTLFCILIFGAIGLIIAQKKYAEPNFTTILFATVVSADENSSVADKEVSSQGLSETIIGWTYSPLFGENLGFGVSAKKQERQNIVLQFETPTEKKAQENAEKLQKQLQEKLKNYNQLSETKFNFLFESPVIRQNTPKKSMLGIAGAILGLFFGSFLSEFLYRGRKNRKK